MAFIYNDYKKLHSCAGNVFDSDYLREDIIQFLFDRYYDDSEEEEGDSYILDILSNTNFTSSARETSDAEKYTLFFKYQSLKEELDLYVLLVAYYCKEPLMFILEKGKDEYNAFYLIQPQPFDYQMRRYITIYDSEEPDGTHEYSFENEEVRNFEYPRKLLCKKIEYVLFDIPAEYFIKYSFEYIENRRKHLLKFQPEPECLNPYGNPKEYFHALAATYKEEEGVVSPEIETVIEFDHCTYLNFITITNTRFWAFNKDSVALLYEIIPTYKGKEGVFNLYEQEIEKKDLDQYERVGDAQEVRVIDYDPHGENWMIKIPEQVEYNGINYKVTQIGKYAFSCNKHLEEIFIPETVKIIGTFAFDNCELLYNVQLPTSLEILDNAAFQGCANLRAIRLPKHIDYIGTFMFAGCISLHSLELPEGIEEANYIVGACLSLREITLPSSFTQAGYEHLTDNYWKYGAYPFTVKWRK